MRVTFLIDGFNLYHSLRRAAREMGQPGFRWLDIKSLCSSYLYLIGREARLEAVHYFSAYATHKERQSPGTVARHRQYVRCLEASGVAVHLGRFKAKDVGCPNCQQSFIRHEEKETDVAIGVKLIELCYKNLADVLVLVSGDTDLAPACRLVQRDFPRHRLGFLFPYGRGNRELSKLAPLHFTIGKERYPQHQFPPVVRMLGGQDIRKPPAW